MKTLLLTEVDFARLKALLSHADLAAHLETLASLRYSLEHTLPCMPSVWDVYLAVSSAQANTNYPEDYDNLYDWQHAAGPLLEAWHAANKDSSLTEDAQ